MEGAVGRGQQRGRGSARRGAAGGAPPLVEGELGAHGGAREAGRQGQRVTARVPGRPRRQLQPDVGLEARPLQNVAARRKVAADCGAVAREGRVHGAREEGGGRGLAGDGDAAVGLTSGEKKFLLFERRR